MVMRRTIYWKPLGPLTLSALLAWSLLACGGPTSPKHTANLEESVTFSVSAEPVLLPTALPISAEAIAMVEGQKISVAIPPPERTEEELAQAPPVTNAAGGAAPLAPELRSTTVKDLLEEGWLAEALGMGHLVNGEWVITAEAPVLSTAEYQGQVTVSWRCGPPGAQIGPAWTVDSTSNRVAPANRYAEVLHGAHDLSYVAETRRQMATVVAVAGGLGAWSELEGPPGWGVRRGGMDRGCPTSVGVGSRAALARREPRARRRVAFRGSPEEPLSATGKRAGSGYLGHGQHLRGVAPRQGPPRVVGPRRAEAASGSLEQEDKEIVQQEPRALRRHGPGL